MNSIHSIKNHVENYLSNSFYAEGKLDKWAVSLFALSLASQVIAIVTERQIFTKIAIGSVSLLFLKLSLNNPTSYLNMTLTRLSKYIHGQGQGEHKSKLDDKINPNGEKADVLKKLENIFTKDSSGRLTFREYSIFSYYSNALSKDVQNNILNNIDRIFGMIYGDFDFIEMIIKMLLSYIRKNPCYHGDEIANKLFLQTIDLLYSSIGDEIRHTNIENIKNDYENLIKNSMFSFNNIKNNVKYQIIKNVCKISKWICVDRRQKNDPIENFILLINIYFNHKKNIPILNELITKTKDLFYSYKNNMLIFEKQNSINNLKFEKGKTLTNVVDLITHIESFLPVEQIQRNCRVSKSFNQAFNQWLGISDNKEKLEKTKRSFNNLYQIFLNAKGMSQAMASKSTKGYGLLMLSLSFNENGNLVRMKGDSYNAEFSSCSSKCHVVGITIKFRHWNALDQPEPFTSSNYESYPDKVKNSIDDFLRVFTHKASIAWNNNPHEWYLDFMKDVKCKF